jgi:hypothetical protein
MVSVMYLMLALYNNADGYVLVPGYLIFALLPLHEITVSVIQTEITVRLHAIRLGGQLAWDARWFVLS